MPQHLDQEQLHRLLHGEAVLDQANLRAHLESCPDCRARLEAAGREEMETLALLRQLDHPPPLLTAEAVMQRARRGSFGWGRWAAGILLLVGLAGAAYAAPGSPLQAWVRAASQWIGRTLGEPSAPGMGLPDEQMAGIAHRPGPQFVVAFTAPDTLSSVRIRLSDVEEVLLRAPPGSAGFTSSADRVTVEIRQPGVTFDLEVPRSAARVEVLVNGRRIWLKENARITGRRAPQNAGQYLLPLTP